MAQEICGLKIIKLLEENWEFAVYNKATWDGQDIDTLKTHSTYGCSTASSAWPGYCTLLIQANGWKIPDDYPFRVKY